MTHLSLEKVILADYWRCMRLYAKGFIMAGTPFERLVADHRTAAILERSVLGNYATH